MVTNVIDFWFSNQNSWILMKGKKRDEFDKIISKLFSKLLNFYEEISIHDIINQKNISKIIEIIICLDQFSRHIYRNTDYNKIKINTDRAVKLSIYLIDNHSDIIMKLNHNYMIFIL